MLNQSVADQHRALHARVRNTLSKAQGQGAPLTIPGYFMISPSIHTQLLSNSPSSSAVSLARVLRGSSDSESLPESYKQLLDRGSKERVIQDLIEYYTHHAAIQSHINSLDL